MRVLVFGASITQGFWDSQGGWVGRLRRHYDELSIQDLRRQEKYPAIFNLGVSGDKIEDLKARFNQETAARLRLNTKNGAIIFSIGTNNAYVEGRQNWLPPEHYIADLHQLVGKAKQYTKKIMFVGLPPCDEEKTTPVFWQDISYTNQRILAVDKMMRQVAAENDLPHVAVFEVFQDEMDRGRRLFADGLHPNEAGHQLIFELVRPVLDEVLAR